MPDDFDLDGLGRFVERVFGRAALHSRAWIAAWLGGILVVTVIAAVASAPTAAYVLLVVIALVAVFADGRREGGP